MTQEERDMILMDLKMKSEERDMLLLDINV